MQNNLPYSNEAEQSVLGSMLIETALIPSILAKVDKYDFYQRSHRIIFEAIKGVYTSTTTPDLITVDEYISNELNEEIGFSYIAEVIKNTPSTSNVMAYVDIMTGYAERRGLIAAANEVIESAVNGDDVSLAEAKEKVNRTSKKKCAPLFDLHAAMEESMNMVFDDPDPVEMVFEECIPMKELAYYTSRGGLGKSFMTIQIGVSLTLGRPVLNGDYPFLTPVKPRKVVIIGGEDYKENYHYRLSGILKDMNLTEDERRQVGSSLLIKSMVGEDIRIIADENGSTKITDFIDRMVETLRPLGEIGLIIFDPQSRFYGGNENDNPTATMFVNAVSRIGRELGAAQLVVHHAPKGDPTGARGASGFIDGARTHLSMISLAYMKSQVKGAVIDDGDAKKPVLSMLKSNHAKMWDRPVIMERTDNGGFKTITASESDNSALKRVQENDRKLAILNFVRANGAQSKNAIESERKNINFNGSTPGRNEIRDLIDKMVTQGQLKKEGDSHRLEIPNRNEGGSVF